MLAITMLANAQNSFGLMGGVNSSTSSTKDVGWRTGGFIGGYYDISFTDWFSLQPRLILSYQENQYKENLLLPSGQSSRFFSQWNITLPVLASFKFQLASETTLRLNAGPYVQYAVFGRDRQQVSPTESRLGWWHHSFKDKLTYGAQIGAQLNYKQFFGTIDYKHSLKRSPLNMDGFENTWQVGIGYKF